MNKLTASITAIVLLSTLLGCQDTPPSSALNHSTISTETERPAATPIAAHQPAANQATPPISENVQPEPVSSPPAVSKDVYGSKPAVKSSAADLKALSWYYMKKKKGEVPNFPHDIRNYRSNQKVAWVGTGKKIYLTFDTGGSLGDVDQMLKALKDNNVKATYFIAGYNMKKYPDFIKRLLADGHLVVNHSMTHKDFTGMTDEQVRQEIKDYEKLYKDITGKDMELYFRFPYGKYNLHLLDVVSEMGYMSVFWSTAMKDWEPRKNGAEDAYQDVMNNLHPGNIILMHQASQENMDALDRIIKQIKEEGYEFGLVNELKPNRP